MAADQEQTEREPGPERVVVGVDGEPASLRALRWAYDAALARGAELEVVHAVPVVQPTGPEMAPVVDIEVLEQSGAALLDQVVSEVLGDRSDDIHVHRVVVVGSPCTVLCEQAEGAAMLVVGRDRGWFRRLLPGATSRLCVRHAPSPVVVVRQEADVQTRRFRRT